MALRSTLLACFVAVALAAPSTTSSSNEGGLRGAASAAFNASKAETSVVSSLTAAAPQCSAEDNAAIDAAGPGNADGTWPKIIASCGRSSYSVFWGFDEKAFRGCISKEVKISDGCASCYSASGAYSAGNCKRCAWSCMFKWCGQKCLDCVQGCNEPNEPVLEACVGRRGPEPEAC